jgi:hypothetical protein
VVDDAEGRGHVHHVPTRRVAHAVAAV